MICQVQHSRKHQIGKRPAMLLYRVFGFNTFYKKDDISFLNPLSVFWFINLSTYFLILSDLPKSTISPEDLFNNNFRFTIVSF